MGLAGSTAWHHAPPDGTAEWRDREAEWQRTPRRLVWEVGPDASLLVVVDDVGCLRAERRAGRVRRWVVECPTAVPTVHVEATIADVGAAVDCAVELASEAGWPDALDRALGALGQH